MRVIGVRHHAWMLTEAPTALEKSRYVGRPESSHAVPFTPAVLNAQLGFGTSHIHRIGESRQRQRLLSVAWEEGVRHFDTARLYGYGIAERELGEFLSGRRAQARIVSKVGFRFPSFATQSPFISRVAKYASAAEKRVRQALRGKASRLDNLIERRDFATAVLDASLEASLEALRTEYLDLLLLHEFEPAVCEDPSPVLDWCVRQKRSGRIRGFGVAGARARCANTFDLCPELCEIIQCSCSECLDETARVEAEGFAPHITYGHFRGKQLAGALLDVQVKRAIQANTAGVVLFSSSREENVRRLARSFRRALAQLQCSPSK